MELNYMGVKKMNKEKICIDLDDTIWEFHKIFFDFYNRKFGTNYKIEDYNIYDFPKFFNLTGKEVLEIFQEFQKTEFSKNLKLLENAKEILNEISESYEIYFVTARHEGLKEETFNELKNLFNFEFKTFFTRREKDHSEIMSKARYCEENGIKIIIEDKLETVLECAAQGMKCILLNYPWNQREDLNENITRVENWEEIRRETL